MIEVAYDFKLKPSPCTQQRAPAVPSTGFWLLRHRPLQSFLMGPASLVIPVLLLPAPTPRLKGDNSSQKVALPESLPLGPRLSSQARRICGSGSCLNLCTLAMPSPSSCARRCSQGIPLGCWLSGPSSCPHPQQRAWRTGPSLPVSASGLAQVQSSEGPPGPCGWVKPGAVVSSPLDLVNSTVCAQCPACSPLHESHQSWWAVCTCWRIMDRL